MDTYWCENCNEYVINRSKPRTLDEASCPKCKKRGLELFDPDGHPFDYMTRLNFDEAKLNLGLPDWFEGTIYEHGRYVENPITGEKIYLTNIEASIYDVANGSQMLLLEIRHSTPVGLEYIYNVKNQGFTEEQCINQLKTDFENASNWLKKNNNKALEIINQANKYEAPSISLPKSPKKIFLTQLASRKGVELLVITPIVIGFYLLLIGSEEFALSAIILYGSILSILGIPFLNTLVFKKSLLIQNIVIGATVLITVHKLTNSNLYWFALISSFILLATFMYQYKKEDFHDIEINTVTELKSRFQDCSTGTFIGLVIGTIINLLG